MGSQQHSSAAVTAALQTTAAQAESISRQQQHTASFEDRCRERQLFSLVMNNQPVPEMLADYECFARAQVPVLQSTHYLVDSQIKETSI